MLRRRVLLWGAISAGLLLLLGTSGLPAACLTSTWISSKDEDFYSNYDCWQPAGVPCNKGDQCFDVVIPLNSTIIHMDLDTCTVHSFTLGANRTFWIHWSGREFLVKEGQARIEGILKATGSEFHAPNATFPGKRARVEVDKGGFVQIGAPAYAAVDLKENSTLLSAVGEDAKKTPSRLDLSALETLDDGFSVAGGRYVHTIAARDGGMIDLSKLTTITGPADDEVLSVALDRGTIDMSSLKTITGGTGSVKFDLLHGGLLQLGDVSLGAATDMTTQGGSVVQAQSLHATKNATVVLNDAGDRLEIAEDLDLGDKIAISARHGATLALQGDFTHSHKDNANVPSRQAQVHCCGVGPQELEVGGWDVGTMTEFLVGGKVIPVLLNDNFGFGRLVVGDAHQPTVVFLVDHVDNGNRYPEAGRDHPEALYLFGQVDPNDPTGQRRLDGLHIEKGSTLYLGGLKVYALLNNKLTDLSTLFGPNEMVKPFQDGYLGLDRPDVRDCRNLAGQAAAGQKVYQFPTDPNTLYHVWFDMSALPGANAAGAGLRVSAAGQFEDFSVPPAGWQTKTWRFTAHAETTTLAFAVPGYPDLPFGGAIANVVVLSPEAPYPPECFRLVRWSITKDTGSDPNDKLTNDATPELRFVFSKPVAGTESDIKSEIEVRHEPDGAGVAKQISVDEDGAVQVTFAAALPDGRYTVTFEGTLHAPRGESLNGGRGDAVSFTVDTTGPRLEAFFLGTNNPSPELTGTVDDPTATVTVALAGTGLTYPAEHDAGSKWRLPAGVLPPLSPGTYDVTVTATDRAGNTRTVHCILVITAS